jgi:hypothetical protein
MFRMDDHWPGIGSWAVCKGRDDRCLAKRDDE